MAAASGTGAQQTFQPGINNDLSNGDEDIINAGLITPQEAVSLIAMFVFSMFFVVTQLIGVDSKSTMADGLFSTLLLYQRS